MVASSSRPKKSRSAETLFRERALGTHSHGKKRLDVRRKGEEAERRACESVPPVHGKRSQREPSFDRSWYKTRTAFYASLNDQTKRTRVDGNARGTRPIGEHRPLVIVRFSSALSPRFDLSLEDRPFSGPITRSIAARSLDDSRTSLTRPLSRSSIYELDRRKPQG